MNTSGMSLTSLLSGSVHASVLPHRRYGDGRRANPRRRTYDAFAEAYQRPVLEAMIAAGIITREDLADQGGR